jgi:CRISPR-associated endoribonuclease Cas6
MDYQYPVSCWIYKIIRNGNPDFKGWLKSNGFISSKQVFRFFSFSNFLLNKNNTETRGDRIMLLDDKVSLVFSVLVKTDPCDFVNSLFLGQELSIGDKKSRVFFKITKVECLEPVELQESIKLKMLSPTVVSMEGIENESNIPISFLSPDDVEYKYQFLKNLFDKVQLLNGKKATSDDFDIDGLTFDFLTDPVKSFIPITNCNNEPIEIPAFTYEFKLQAPPNLLSAGLDGGFGWLNNKGFGVAEIIEEVEEYPFYS